MPFKYCFVTSFRRNTYHAHQWCFYNRCSRLLKFTVYLGNKGPIAIDSYHWSIGTTYQLLPSINSYHSYHWSISICRLQFSAIFGISSQKVVTSILLNCLTNLFAKWIEYSMLNIHNYCGQWEITFIDKKKLQHFIFT